MPPKGGKPRTAIGRMRAAGLYAVEEKDCAAAMQEVLGAIDGGPGAKIAEVRSILERNAGRALNDEEWAYARRVIRRIKRAALMGVVAKGVAILPESRAAVAAREASRVPAVPGNGASAPEAPSVAYPIGRLSVEYGRLFQETERARDMVAKFAEDVLVNIRRRRAQLSTCSMCGGGGSPADWADLRSEERNFASMLGQQRGFLSVVKDLHKISFDAQRTIRMQEIVMEFFVRNHPELADEFAAYLEKAGL